MIRIRFFARVRDEIGCAELVLDTLPDAVESVGALTEYLKSRDEVLQRVLSEPNILVAVNQEMALPTDAVKIGDEIAYFPPVTGG